MNVQIPMLTEKDSHTAYRHASNQDIEAYAQYLYTYLSDIFSESDKYVCIFAFPVISKHYSAVQIVIQDTPPSYWFNVENTAVSNITLLNLFSKYRINELFYQLKNTLFFSEQSLYIIKPNYYKNWHPAIAKLDLLEAVEQILYKNGGNG